MSYVILLESFESNISFSLTFFLLLNISIVKISCLRLQKLKTTAICSIQKGILIFNVLCCIQQWFFCFFYLFIYYNYNDFFFFFFFFFFWGGGGGGPKDVTTSKNQGCEQLLWFALDHSHKLIL